MARTELFLDTFSGKGDIDPLLLPYLEIRDIFTADALAALASARIVRKVFNGVPLDQLHVEFKEDETPKTIADTEGDFAIYKAIRRLRPQDEMMLEETGYHQALAHLHPTSASAIRHYADSLDGSRPFIEGKPWSTVGVGATRENGDYLTGVIVHPFRQHLGVAVRGMGAYLIPLNGGLLPNGKPEELHVSNKDSLAGGTVCVDSLFTKANTARKHSLMSALEDTAGTAFSYDMTGSNIAYQLEVARGRSILGITDAVGGPWDWRVGEALITEAGGQMLDVLSGKNPTDKSTVVIYGNRNIVDLVLPIANNMYAGYQGFNK